MNYEMLRRPEGWLLALAGLAWFAAAGGHGAAAFVFAALPGALLVTSATATFLFPGDRSITRIGATGALLGLVMSVPLLLFAPLTAILLAALSAVAGLAAGRLASEDIEVPEELEHPGAETRVAAEIALDEGVLGLVTAAMGVWARDEQSRVAGEVGTIREWLEAGGWDTAPEAFHEEPPTMGPTTSDTRRVAGLQVEVVRFDSEFEPRQGAPGRDRWLSYAGCRSSEVRLVRHRESEDWLVCVHGLGMGYSPIDLRAFDAARLRRQGVNLAFPVLPLHGSRARRRLSGEGFVTGEVADTLHALTQTAWDLRRIIRWLRAEGARRVGLYGLSLGGYSTALTASLEDGLDCAIPAIPAVDLAELMWFHAGQRALRLGEGFGLDVSAVAEALRPVSPLAVRPKTPKDRRFIFAALADRFVPAAQAYALWEHWDRPEIAWYPGGHLGFRFHPEVGDFVARALDGTLLAREA